MSDPNSKSSNILSDASLTEILRPDQPSLTLNQLDIFLLSDIAEVVFNKCTTLSDDAADSQNFTVNLDYEFLEDIYAEWIDTVGDDVSIASEDSPLFEPETLSLFSVEQRNAEYKSIDTKTENEKLRDLERKKNHPLMLMVRDLF
jgi:hypothetical protein